MFALHVSMPNHFDAFDAGLLLQLVKSCQALA